MEKKIIAACAVVGVLILLSTLYFKDTMHPIVFARIWAVGIGLTIPRIIQNIIGLF